MLPRLSHAELDRLIREVELRLSRSLLAALTRVRQGLPIAELERAILERNIAAASRTLGLEPLQNALAEIQAQLPPLREAGWASATQGLPRVILQESTLDITLGAAANERPDLLRAVAAQDLSRIRAITTETQQAFEEALRAGITKGTPPQVLARQVRGMLGLNRAQAGALDKFRLALETEGRDPAQVERMVARKSQQYLNLRSNTITQSETMRALNEGQRLQRERLVAEGVIEEDEFEQEWVTASDERTCPICLPLHGERAPIGSSFQSSVGSLTAPPAHVNCRCVTRTVLKGFRKGESPASARERVLRQTAPLPADTGRAIAARVLEAREGRPSEVVELAAEPFGESTQTAARKVWGNLSVDEHALLEQGNVEIAFQKERGAVRAGWGQFNLGGDRPTIEIGPMAPEDRVGTIAHETGHAIDNRLVGGGSPGRWFWSDSNKE